MSIPPNTVNNEVNSPCACPSTVELMVNASGIAPIHGKLSSVPRRYRVGTLLSHVDESRRTSSARWWLPWSEQNSGRYGLWVDEMSRGGRASHNANTCDATKLRHLICATHVAVNKLISSLDGRRQVDDIKRPLTGMAPQCASVVRVMVVILSGANENLLAMPTFHLFSGQCRV